MVIAYGGGGGGGKTHTLTGVLADPGCVPLAIINAFRIIGEEEGSVEVRQRSGCIDAVERGVTPAPETSEERLYHMKATSPRRWTGRVGISRC